MLEPPTSEAVFKTHIARFPMRRVYFAGKIEKNCWRHTIVTTLRGIEGLETEANEVVSFWNDTLQCTGPFFNSCDHGCAHGEASHGMAAGRGAQCGSVDSPRDRVFKRCMEGIRQADTVFAWIDQDYHTAYGTLIELGHAHHARKNIVLGVHPTLQPEQEIWFLPQIATSVVMARTALDAFTEYATKSRPARP